MVKFLSSGTSPYVTVPAAVTRAIYGVTVRLALTVRKEKPATGAPLAELKGEITTSVTAPEVPSAKVAAVYVLSIYSVLKQQGSSRTAAFPKALAVTMPDC